MAHKQRVKKGQPIDGWLNFYKPSGMGSTNAVAKLKRYYDAQKCGHAGTLDPLAHGILPLAFGNATKTVEYLMDADKDYTFTVQFGSATNTDDIEGEVLADKTSDKVPTQEEIEAILPKFVGKIQQTPPQFSAIKINGVRSYAAARKGDDVKIPSREVTVYDLELEKYDSEQRLAYFSCRVGKGTYVRALARDMGELLGCYGHITELSRTRVGQFKAEDAITEQMLDNAADDGVNPQQWLQDASVVLVDLPVYAATFAEVRDLLSGKNFKRIHLGQGQRQVVDPTGKVRSIINFKANGWCEIVKNFN